MSAKNCQKDKFASASRRAKQSRKARHFNALLDCFASLANAHFLFFKLTQTFLTVPANSQFLIISVPDAPQLG